MNETTIPASTPPAHAEGLRIRRFRSWFRKWSRGWRRGLMAYWNPMRFGQWVNEQRCSVTIENDPFGRWSVRIGCLANASVRNTIGEAMCQQFCLLNQNPNWTWPCDYLESVNTERSGGAQ